MKNNKAKPTIYDVAEQAGVSPMTVTRSLNYQDKVAPKTLKKVMDVIKRLDYCPDATAQSLTKRKTKQIAFTLSSDTTLGLANSFYGTALAGAVESCSRHNYQCLVNVYNFSNLDKFVMPDEIKRRGIDGIIVTGYASKTVLNKLNSLDTPLIFLGEPRVKVDFPVVTADTIETLEFQISYLLKKGHHKIGFPPVNKEFIKTTSIPEVKLSFFAGNNNKYDSFKAGKENAEKWLKMHPSDRPTAICGDDQWSVAFLSTIQEAGLKCPDDISILSGESPLSKWSSPKLTTYAIDIYNASFRTAELLIDFFENPFAEKELAKRASQIKVPGKLTERCSIKDLT